MAAPSDACAAAHASALDAAANVADPCSAANFKDVRVTNMSLHWNVQFAKRVVSGYVDFAIEVRVSMPRQCAPWTACC